MPSTQSRKASDYQTRELAVATFIYMRSGHLPDFNWHHGRCTFVFPRSNAVDDLIRLITAGEALVEPILFTMRQADLKRAMFAVRPQ